MKAKSQTQCHYAIHLISTKAPKSQTAFTQYLAPISKTHSKETLVFCGLGRHVSPVMC